MADVTNYTIENNSGQNVRIDLNAVFAAIQSSNSKSSDFIFGKNMSNKITQALKQQSGNEKLSYYRVSAKSDSFNKIDAPHQLNLSR